LFFLKSFIHRKTKDELILQNFILKRFKHRPKNLLLFKAAITHKSISNTKDFGDSNERLEFLGDSILDAAVAEYIYKKFPSYDEGYLTQIKSKIVSRKTLSIIGEEMQLRDVLHYQKGRAINLNTLEGNAFEALIGAIFLDSNYKKVQKLLYDHIFVNFLDLHKILEEEIDFKSKLFIWSQKNQHDLEFILVSDDNNNGVWNYIMQVNVNGAPYGKGSGGSKKQAEQAASKETLELLGEM
jgi:ribonuclease-3